MIAVLLVACPSPGGGGPGGNPPPEVALAFEQATVRKSKMLVSTNGNASQTYTNNTLSLGTTPVTAGAASYRISANPGSHTPEEISVNPDTGEVTFTKALYDNMTPSDLSQPTGPPAGITIEATYQGQKASYTFTVTDHFRPRRNHSSVVLGTDIWTAARTYSVWQESD